MFTASIFVALPLPEHQRVLARVCLHSYAHSGQSVGSAAGCSAAVLVAILSMSTEPLSWRRSCSTGACMLGTCAWHSSSLTAYTSAYSRLISFCVWWDPTHVHVFVCIHTFVCMWVCVSTCIHMQKCVTFSLCIFTCPHIYMYIYFYIYIRIYIYIYTYIYINLRKPPEPSW